MKTFSITDENMTFTARENGLVTKSYDREDGTAYTEIRAHNPEGLLDMVKQDRVTAEAAGPTITVRLDRRYRELGVSMSGSSFSADSVEDLDHIIEELKLARAIMAGYAARLEVA